MVACTATSSSPQALDAQTKLFSALRHLGFKEREIRVVLAQLRAEPGLRGASLQDQLREALRRLHPPQPLNDA
jgi:Holliday junction resolvasome RuvABC DNA-binding subunit